MACARRGCRRNEASLKAACGSGCDASSLVDWPVYPRSRRTTQASNDRRDADRRDTALRPLPALRPAHKPLPGGRTHWSVANEIEQHDQEPSRDAQMPAACCVVGIWITVKDYCSERAVARPREGGRRLRRPN